MNRVTYVTDDVSMISRHLRPNVITLKSLIHLRKMLLHLGLYYIIKGRLFHLGLQQHKPNDVVNGLSESPEGDRGYHVYIHYCNVAALISTNYVVVLFVNFLCSVINTF